MCIHTEVLRGDAFMTDPSTPPCGPVYANSIDVETLFRHHHRWLVDRVIRRIGCPETAADVAQDTFLRLMTGFAGKEAQAPKALLGRIAHGLLVDRLRRRDIEQAYLRGLAQLPAAQEPTSEELIEVVDMLHRLSTALDGLKPRARAVFLLSRIDGHTYPAIAARLGVSLRTVEKDMALALWHCYRIWHS